MSDRDSMRYAVTVRVSARDFEHLTEQAQDAAGLMCSEVGSEYVRNWPGRFIDYSTGRGKDAVFEQEWKYAYWVGNEYVNVLLARSFLESIGERYQVVGDEATEDDGRPFGWVIFT